MCAHGTHPLYLQPLARWHTASKRKTLVSGTLGYNDRMVAEGNTYCFVIDEGTTGRRWPSHANREKPQHKKITRLPSTHVPRRQEQWSTGQHLQQNYHCLKARICPVTDVSQKSYLKPVVVVAVQSYTRSDWCCAVLLMEYWQNITVSFTNSDVVLPMPMNSFPL